MKKYSFTEELEKLRKLCEALKVKKVVDYMKISRPATPYNKIR